MFSEFGQLSTMIFRRQPLLVGSVFFLVGIAWGYHRGMWLLALPAALLCGGFVLFAPPASCWRIVGRVVLFFVMGWGVAARDLDGRCGEAAQFPQPAERQTFLCRVGPDVQVTPLRGKAARYRFRGESLQAIDGATECRFLPVDITWYGAKNPQRQTVPRPGEVWRVSGKPRLRRARGGLQRLTLNVGEERSARVMPVHPASWRARVTRARRLAAARVTLGIESWGAIPLLHQAMLLGKRQELPYALRRIFIESGTIHVFAISGLHIVLVAAVLTLAVSTVGVPRPYWVIVLAPPLIFYTVITGARPSAVRACLMTLLYFVAPLLGRKPDGMSALSGTVLLVYGTHPWLLYDAGSTLSFVVMAGLIIFCRPFCRVGQRLCCLHALSQKAALLAAAGETRRAGYIRRLTALLRWITDAFAVSLAAWLASVPLTAHFFGRITPGGLFANLIVGPCAFGVVMAGCLGMITSVLSEWTAVCFNHAAGFFTQIMVVTATRVTALPGASFRVTRWSGWMVWGWFVLLLVLALWLNTKRQTSGLAWLDEADQGLR